MPGVWDNQLGWVRKPEEELVRFRNERASQFAVAMLDLHKIAQGREATVGLDLVGHLAVTGAQQAALRLLELAAYQDQMPKVARLLGELAEKVHAEDVERRLAESTGATAPSGEAGATWLELTERLVPMLLGGARGEPRIGSIDQLGGMPVRVEVVERVDATSSAPPSPPPEPARQLAKN